MSLHREQARHRRVLTQALATIEHHLSQAPQRPLPLFSGEAVPPALASLAQALGLSAFERDALLLATAPQLDARIGPLLARAQGNEHQPWLNTRLALGLLAESSWDATTPVAPLRHWQLIDLVGGTGPLDARWAVDEAVLHHIAGSPYPDPRLDPWLPALASRPPGSVEARHIAAIDHLAATWEACEVLATTPVARLTGPDAEPVVHTLAHRLGLSLHRLVGPTLPPAGAEREQLTLLWAREALLRRGLLWVDATGLDEHAARDLAAWVDRQRSLVVVTGDLRLQRQQHPIDCAAPDAAGRRVQWREVLGERCAAVDIDAVAEQFQLPRNTLRRAAQGLHATSTADQLWQACREAARQGLDGLAQRIDARAGWGDLVLPEAALASLRALAAQMRHRGQVYRRWGFAERSARGLGISALFSGGSGTGKTLAAEVLAQTLQLDLYRIDLAAQHRTEPSNNKRIAMVYLWKTTEAFSIPNTGRHHPSISSPSSTSSSRHISESVQSTFQLFAENAAEVATNETNNTTISSSSPDDDDDDDSVEDDSSIIVDHVKEAFPEGGDIFTFEMVDHRPLGCTVEESLDKDDDYVFISRITPDGNADKAGLKVGDVVVGVTGLFGGLTIVMDSGVEKM